MFDNIGGKIKTTAKVVCWLGIIASVVVAIACWANGNPQDDGFGIGYLIGGSLASWVGSFLVYGFGELIERAVSIDNYLKKASVPNQASDTSDVKKAVPVTRTSTTEGIPKETEQSKKTYYSDLPDL